MILKRCDTASRPLEFETLKTNIAKVSLKLSSCFLQIRNSLIPGRRRSFVVLQCLVCGCSPNCRNSRRSSSSISGVVPRPAALETSCSVIPCCRRRRRCHEASNVGNCAGHDLGHQLVLFLLQMLKLESLKKRANFSIISESFLKEVLEVR